MLLLALLLPAEFPRGACGPSPLPLRIVPIPNASVLRRHAQPPKCALFVFLHPQSSGGTSIDSLLGAAVASSDWECSSLAPPELAGNLTNASWVRDHPRVYVRFHERLSRSRLRVAPLLAARGAYEALGCRLVVGTLLRDPVSHLLSWWNHFGVRKHRNMTLAQLLASDSPAQRVARCPQLDGQACQLGNASVGSGVRGMYLREIGALAEPQPGVLVPAGGPAARSLAARVPTSSPTEWCDWVGMTESMGESVLQLADMLALRVVPNLHVRHYGAAQTVLAGSARATGAPQQPLPGGPGDPRRRLGRRPAQTLTGPQEVLSGEWLRAQLADAEPPWLRARAAIRARLAAHAAADPTFGARVALFGATPRYSIKFCSKKVCLLAAPRRGGVPWRPDDTLLLCPRRSRRWLPHGCSTPGVHRGK